MSLATRLYRGELAYDFIGHRRWYYAFSSLVIVIGLVSLIVRGLNLGIDFKGGDSFQFKANGHSVATATAILSAEGIKQPVVQKIGEDQIEITTPVLSDTTANDQVDKLASALASAYGLPNADAVTVETVGSTWGSQITHKAVEGLIIFLIATIIYITFRFTGKMAVAAIVALLHDLLVTVGIYSLSGFVVSPSTVIAVLTILGFSLYDTVVVFDKVRENTADISPRSNRTYTDSANLAINQTLMRSINTSLIALLPVAALLFVGAGLLGAGTLKDLALAQFVGLASGAYSSIFIATPLLAQLKEREPGMQELQKRVAFLATHKPRAVAVAGAPGTRGGGTAMAGTGTAVAVLSPPELGDTVTTGPTQPTEPTEPVTGRPAAGAPALGLPGPSSPIAAPATSSPADPGTAGANLPPGLVGTPGSPGASAPPARTPGSPMQRSDNRRRRGKGGRPSGKRKR